MKNLKEVQVVMLATKEGKLGKMDNHLGLFENLQHTNEVYEYQHLYFISDDEIKEGDWCISQDILLQAKSSTFNHIGAGREKIIASTDNLFTNVDKFKTFEDCKKGRIIPQIPQSFMHVYIKAFNNGTPINTVSIELEENGDYEIGNREYINYSIKTREDGAYIIHQSKMYSREDMLRFKKDTEMFSSTAFSRKYKSILTNPEMEDKWFEENS